MSPRTSSAAKGGAWPGGTGSLASLLQFVDADAGASFVEVGAGQFATVLTRVEAASALLATHLGDAPVPPEHGGPLRLIVPGADCYTSIKWVDHIEVLRAPHPDRAREIALARIGIDRR